jgi:hypothetical protein
MSRMVSGEKDGRNFPDSSPLMIFSLSQDKGPISPTYYIAERESSLNHVAPRNRASCLLFFDERVVGHLSVGYDCTAGFRDSDNTHGTVARGKGLMPFLHASPAGSPWTIKS